MRLPNNYGTVYKLSGNRHNPWIARKKTGEIIDPVKKAVKPIYHTIGYFSTRADALTALGAFNATTGASQDRPPITLKQLYDLWAAEHLPKIKNPLAYKTAATVLAPLYDVPFESLKLDDITRVIDQAELSPHVRARTKSMLMLMSDYGIIHELIANDRRGILRHIDTGDMSPKIDRRLFAPDEIARLWEQRQKYDGITLILLHTGMRIGELLDADPENIDIENQCIAITRAKTKAGVRTVPIADRIVPLVRAYLAMDKRPSYHAVHYWMRTAYKHAPHDTRHTFTTLCVEHGVDQRIIDKMVGHSTGNISMTVYTHITNAVMLDAVNNVFGSAIC